MGELQDRFVLCGLHLIQSHHHIPIVWITFNTEPSSHSYWEAIISTFEVGHCMYDWIA